LTLMMASSLFLSIMVRLVFFWFVLKWPFSSLVDVCFVVVGDAGDGDSTFERSSDFKSAVFGSFGVDTGD
jgi:hypothetical protein